MCSLLWVLLTDNGPLLVTCVEHNIDAHACALVAEDLSYCYTCNTYKHKYMQNGWSTLTA